MEEKPLSSETFIYVSEAQNWTDSTSVIAMRYSEAPPTSSHDTLRHKMTDFMGHHIIYTPSSFEGLIEKEHLIPTNLDWVSIIEREFEPISENKRLSYSEYEMQIIYNFRRQKIQSVLNAYPLDEGEVFEKLLRCN